MYEKYIEEQRGRFVKNFNRKKHQGFDDKYDFSNWYCDQLIAYNCECYYCETSIFNINILIDIGLLKERKTGNGYRGRILEVDKNDEEYTKEECVLACMYCNNDKSYILGKEDYKIHFGGNRKNYFNYLMNKHKQ